MREGMILKDSRFAERQYYTDYDGDLNSNIISLYNQDPMVIVRVEFPEKLKGLFDSIKNNQGISVPSVLEREIGNSNSTVPKWKGRLLAPSDYQGFSEYFLEGLVIPDLKVRGTITEGDKLKGYKMTSEYAGFDGMIVKSDDLLLKQKQYQGVITKSVDFNYEVKIILPSVGKTDLFAENNKYLSQIKKSEKAFWWNSG